MEGIQQMKSSMQKMKRKQMDLIQVHNLVDYKTHLQTLREWKDEGIIRYLGITHYLDSAHDELERIIKAEKPDFVQFNYSITARNAEKRLLDVSMGNGVAVIINEPLDKGRVFNLVKGKNLPSWAGEYEIKTWAEYFLKYIISHPSVNCVIPATSVPHHMLDNMMAGFGSVPDTAGRIRMINYLESL